MDKFSYIPEDLRPDETLHTDHAQCFRAIKDQTITKEDFFPTFHEKRMQKAMNKVESVKVCFKQSDYSVSLFNTIDKIKKIYDVSPIFRKKYNWVAKGFTSRSRGISYAASKNGHIDYFLYDFEGNNPYQDFELIQEINNE
ncbi:hypothetical protein [uncultured Bacteroides sp.]|uniref:hypothetical protein n=1 Tax=uncultured Bacteroides sp. TaxID=162156 RepID=UPI0026249B1C|nr:hypothetical protein [uncultured Bacteroides sp.]